MELQAQDLIWNRYVAILYLTPFSLNFRGQSIAKGG